MSTATAPSIRPARFGSNEKAQPLQDELDAALKAVRQCCRVCRTVQQSIRPETLEKKDKSPVTIADYASQAVVGKILAQECGSDVLVAEEGADFLRSEEHAAFLARVCDELATEGLAGGTDDVLGWIDHGSGKPAKRFWTLDPIDGTKGFLRGGQYAISLALIIDGSVELSVLGLPNFPHDGEPDPKGAREDTACGLMLYAIRGVGAWAVPVENSGAQPRRLSVTPTQQTSDARWTESVESGHSAHDVSAQIAQRLGIVREPVRMDSQAKYAAVAMGLADAYLRMPTRKDYREKIWDHAGGVAVVEEAGGRVTDIDGQPLDFTRGHELTENRGVVVTNGILHNDILAAIAETSA